LRNRSYAHPDAWLAHRLLDVDLATFCKQKY
jgi:hypothetical protein